MPSPYPTPTLPYPTLPYPTLAGYTRVKLDEGHKTLVRVIGQGDEENPWEFDMIVIGRVPNKCSS